MPTFLSSLRERRIKNRELEKRITHHPLTIDQDRILESNLSEKIIIDRSIERSMAFLLAGMLILIMSPLFFIPFNNGISYFCFFICNLPFLYFLYIGCFNPHREIIFDRIAGTINYSSWGKSKTVIFEKTPFVGVDTKSRGGHIVYSSIQILYTHGLFGYSIFTTKEIADIFRYWSFIVWYMDKNRPLPTGEIFDPYREADYERRRLEGFPKPLYSSQLSIPQK